MTYELVIGLEIHAQLKTASKLFCTCSTQAAYDLDSPPNTFICPICAGHPGVLPAPINREAVRLALRLASACGCAIHDASRIDRKNYFYPDLPKGYQLSQFYAPIGTGGGVDIFYEGALKRIPLRRMHIEEDAGRIKTERVGKQAFWLVDFNRCGVPLVEIVTEPVLRSSDEAVELLREMRRLLRHLGVSEANLEAGNLRCDVNLSLRPSGTDALGVKTEIKNLNSFQFVKEAIDAETKRQQEILAAGGQVVQATVGYDQQRKITRVQRVKERESGYRYFREPDQVSARLDDRLRAEATADLPAPPAHRLGRYLTEYALPDADARALIDDRRLADHFEGLVAAGVSAKGAFNWTMNDAAKTLNIGADLPPAPDIAYLLTELEAKRITLDGARKVYLDALRDGKPIRAVFAAADVSALDGDALAGIVTAVLAADPKNTEAYLSGNEKALNPLVGAVMKQVKGKASGDDVRRALLAALANR